MSSHKTSVLSYQHKKVQVIQICTQEYVHKDENLDIPKTKST